ncbi:putative uncharacterized protein DDB_G0271606 [Varroa jacobsoni]|uniref:Uncharacterized protein n=1 Tax=Varroa destructor TaxID=109461 RepID=A0A7M7JGR9_VARDE|nr:putative uncharacterized protein DDB_G0271606 [Varroa destructor]XP_022696086.1 putative uncharacterized protein DDB_G0271606 [Varroa jacobsoni]
MKVLRCSVLLASAALVQGFSKGGSRVEGSSRDNSIAPGWILEFANGGSTQTPATKGGFPQITSIFPEIFTNRLPNVRQREPLRSVPIQQEATETPINTYVPPIQTYPQSEQRVATLPEIASMPRTQPNEVIHHHFQIPAPQSSLRRVSQTITMPPIPSVNPTWTHTAWGLSPYTPTPVAPTWTLASMPNPEGINSELLTHLIECIKHSHSSGNSMSHGSSRMTPITSVPVPAPALVSNVRPQYIHPQPLSISQPIPQQILQQLPQQQQVIQPQSQQQQQVVQPGQQQIIRSGPQQQIIQHLPQQQQQLIQPQTEHQQHRQQQIPQTSQRIQAPQQIAQVPQQIVHLQPQQTTVQVQSRPQHLQQPQEAQQQQIQPQQIRQTQPQQIQPQQLQQQPQQIPSQQILQQQQQAQHNTSSLPLLPGVHPARPTAPSPSANNNRLPGMPSLIEINQQLQPVSSSKTG